MVRIGHKSKNAMLNDKTDRSKSIFDQNYLKLGLILAKLAIF